MKKESKILITKDAVNRSYLPVYGNTYWKTPNIDELAEKGTVFYRHYTGAPSTNMANMCMFTGQYSYESDMKDYVISNMAFTGDTLFDKAAKLGYKSHIIWNESWFQSKTIEFYNCYGRDTVFHSLPGLKQGVGAHYFHKVFLQENKEVTEQVYRTIEKEISSIVQSDEKVFVWIHIPHVINGRTGYGQDIDAFDDIVGIIRKYFSDSSIYISSDHGNMNGVKGKLCYGFDVYEPAIIIPLITPRLGEKKRIDELTCNTDLFSIIFEDQIPAREYVYSDTAFYAQPNRKFAVISRRFKYIYNKLHDTEELYDLEIDPHEDCNIIRDYIYDKDRRVITPLRELYFYPYWDMAREAEVLLREKKNEIWRKGTIWDELYGRGKYFLKIYVYYKLKKYILRAKGVTDGSTTKRS